jgi:hypothetical protein
MPVTIECEQRPQASACRPSGSRPAPCTHSALCSRSCRSCSRPVPCKHFGLCNRVCHWHLRRSSPAAHLSGCRRRPPRHQRRTLTPFPADQARFLQWPPTKMLVFSSCAPFPLCPSSREVRFRSTSVTCTEGGRPGRVLPMLVQSATYADALLADRTSLPVAHRRSHLRSDPFHALRKRVPGLRGRGRPAPTFVVDPSKGVRGSWTKGLRLKGSQIDRYSTRVGADASLAVAPFVSSRKS